MFSAEALDEAAAFVYDPAARRLELRLHPDAEALYGEVAAARFDALCKALGVAAAAVTVGGERAA
jgi:exopolyphosphatase/guanosine-5'-triphosphate,3'-diphosphate pyrophosphatase